MNKQNINSSITEGSLLLFFQFCIHLMNLYIFQAFFTSWIRIQESCGSVRIRIQIRNTAEGIYCISLLERTAQPFVFRRKDSPNLSPPALAAVIQMDRQCSILQKERREVGRGLPMEDEGGQLSVLRVIYILCFGTNTSTKKFL